ncbi:1-(5-phosphoribosyl)-5-[(5-phosphoribosylamino)methylideneamino] imidazole-4-carboxamide isomerase [Dokdonella sp.]|uniref:1-(5-phosphoribosyl)-5-[(5- phosphoribosylamino)methylideneamino] imidazole-4-carboxamide isomerase n=1 Tax=Dokdonella sp. TaxID=2291710 RepID=UPI003C33F3AF
MKLEIIPALDLREGRVVRLRQGDYNRETGYAVNAMEQACKYRDAGATWLHVVDLDGARAGKFENLALIETLAGLGLQIQAGGGVRDESDLRRLFAVGVQRVVLGSIAVREPDRVMEWISTHGAQQLVIALDTRWLDGRWQLSSAGWTEAAAVTLDELAPRYARSGAQHILCTDIERDGMLSGPNLELYAHLSRIAPDLRVQASGGVRDEADVKALQGKVAGVILGRSLLEGQLDLASALEC